jgi:hypothetical protein
MPATWELVVCLLGLPALLLSGFWLGRKLLTPREAPAAVATHAASGSRGGASGQTAGLAILAASVRSPRGASPEELATAIANNKARPDLDQELVDADGFPIMTARCMEATDEALREEIIEWLAENGLSELHFNDEQWRALTLANAVVVELGSYAAGKLLSDAGDPPALQLITVTPPKWTVEQGRAAGLWLKHALSESGWKTGDIRLSGEGLAKTDAATPATTLERLVMEAGAAGSPLATLLVAFSSSVGEETIADWEENGLLFSASQNKGMIPGEGAAGLLLTSMPEADASFAVLGSMDTARLDVSADESRRANATLLAGLAERVLKKSNVSCSDVKKIVADTGSRSSRVLELMGYASTMTHLEETDDVACVGVASGSCDAVPFITALALAQHYAGEIGAPVLCFSNEDPHHRVAALIHPAHTSS